MRTRCSQKMRYVSGTADLRIQQPFDQPYLDLRVERTKAEELGFTAHDIAQNLLVSLSGSFQTSPTFWVDPKNHVSYSDRNPDAAVPHGHVAGSAEHSHHRHRSDSSSIAHGQSGLDQAWHRDGGGFALQRGAGD